METFLGIDYNVWWFLVFGAVISGYAILDGFDLGAGALHLFLKKEEILYYLIPKNQKGISFHKKD